MKLRWTNDGVVLEEAHDFKSFKVQVDRPGARPDELASAFAGIATFADPDTAWISEAVLRHWRGHEGDPSWQKGLDGMIAKAKPYGWINEADKTIRAHVEWPQGDKQ